MENDKSYGTQTKRIVFTDTEHNHAKLLIRLRHDELSQAAFFRHVLNGYINGDSRIQGYIDEVKPQSKIKKDRTRKMREKGKQNLQSLNNLSNKEVESLFDLIAEEHPDL